MIFGQGIRPLRHLKREDGVLVKIGKVEKKRRLGLLLNPKGEAQYITASLAQGTREQIAKNLKRFKKGVAECVTRKTTSDVGLALVQHQGHNHLLIDLDESKPLRDALRASKVFKDRLLSVALHYQNKEVGFAFFYNQEVIIVSASNLMLAGSNNILALTVHALEARVCVVSPLVVANACKVYSRNSILSSEDHKPILTAGSLEILSVERCELDAIIEVSGPCQLRATDFKLSKPFEGQDHIMVFAEKTEIHSSIVAKNKLEFFSKDFQALKSSHLHGQIISIVAANKASLEGFASSQGLGVFANQASLSGSSFINGDVVLQAQGEAPLIEATKTAKLFYSGSFSTNSPNLAWFEGLLEHVPDLIVAPKAILDPFQKLTDLEEKQLLIKKRTALPLGTYYGVKFLPKSPEGKTPLYLIGSFNQQPPIDTEAEAHCAIQAAHLYVKGTMVTPPHVRLNASHTLLVSAYFSSYRFSVPAEFLLHAEKCLESKNSSFNTLGAVKLSSNADLDLIDSLVKAGSIAMQAENISISGITYLDADRIAIQAKGKVEVKPEATVTMMSKQAAIIGCKDFESQGSMIFQDLLIRADGLIKLYHAQMRGTNLSLDCRYLLTGWSSFSIDNKLLVTALASFMALSHVHAGFYINNSFLDLSASLYTPALGELSPRLGLSVLLAAVNSGLSIAQMLVHDPLIQTALSLGRMTINTVPAFLGTIQLVNDIYKTASKIQDRASLITLANLIKNVLYTLAGFGYSLSGLPSRLSFDTEPMVSLGPDDLLSTLNKINMATGPLIALIQRGRATNSFVSLEGDLELGLLSSSNTSGFFVDLSDRLVQSTSRRSVLYLEPNPLSFDAAPNTNEGGLLDFSFSSSAILPFGSCNKQFLSIDAYAPLGLPQHMSIEANQLRCHGHQDFVHSSIAVQGLQTEGEFRLEQGSSLTAKTLMNSGGKAEIIQSTAQIRHWDNHNGAENYLTASNVCVDEMALPQGAGLQTFASHLKVKSLEVEDGGLFSAGGYSKIEGDNFVFSQKARIGSATSDWHVGKLSSPGFDLEIDNAKSYTPPKQASALEYCSSSTLEAGLTREGIIYASTKKLSIENRGLVGLSSLSLAAPAIVVSGKNSASMPLEFDTPDLKFEKAKNDFQGPLTVHADKVSEIDSNTKVQGSLVMRGLQLSCKGGSFKASGAMGLSFKETKAEGTKTVVRDVKKHHGFFSTKKEVRETTYFKNLVFASDTRISMQGNLDFTGVDLDTNKLNLDRAHILKFCPMQAENSHSTSHTNLFGSKHREEKTQVESASHLRASDMDINTDILRIKGSNVLGKKVHIQADTMEASASILKSSKKTSHVGLGFKANLPSLEQSPLYTLSQPLKKGAFSSETLPDLVKRGAIASNMAAELLKDAHQQNSLGAIQAITGFNPSVSVSFGKESSYYEQEHQGEGALLADDLSLDVHRIRWDNNYMVHVSNQAEITTDSLRATAAKLHTVYRANQLALVDNLGLSGNDWGLSFGHQSIYGVQSQGGGLNFNQLKLQANELNLDGETLGFQGLESRVNHFSSIAGVNSQQINTYNGSIFASGVCNYQHHTERSQTLADPGQSVSDKNPVPIYDIQQSFGLSGSWKDALPSSFAGHTGHGSSVFSLWDLQSSKDNSITNSHHHTHLTIPKYHAEAGRELWKNWDHNAYQGPQRSPLASPSAGHHPKQAEHHSAEQSQLVRNKAALDSAFDKSHQRQTGENQNYWPSGHPEATEKEKEEVGLKAKAEFDPAELSRWLIENLESLEENIPFAIAKINLVKSCAWSLYGVSAGLGCYALYHSDNHFEEAGHIGFLMLSGSAGWELGVAAATIATAPASLPVELVLGVCGSIAVNITANEVWEGYLTKIKENIAIDRKASFFYPNTISNPFKTHAISDSLFQNSCASR